MEKLYNDTIALEKKMKDMGYTVTVMWECEWNKQKASLLDIES
jgi:G:T-mismatch repair DNA endonuclease (very short patch repair protein)